jgi:hypothetical protein
MFPALGETMSYVDDVADGVPPPQRVTITVFLPAFLAS